MDQFNALGNEIESLWLERNYNEEDLPAIAAAALRRADLPSQASAWDVANWALGQSELPPQRDLHGNFADPPITIYSGPRFHIDLYFWFEGTTAIHQHAFCGAFQVLMGSSIHSWYEFEAREVVNKFVEIGEMSLKVCELLNVGDVQEIWGGKRYIHSLFHLEQPSATIVVRTDRSPIELPQFSYEKPNLAIDPFFEQPTTTKKLQILAAAFRAKHPGADQMATDWLEKADLQTTFTILSRLRHLVGANQLEQMFGLDSGKGRFALFLKAVEQRHGKSGEIFAPIFDRLDAIEEIVRLRSLVVNPEHRFFLALLMNVDTRDQILSLIRQRFPETDPIENILDWVFDLSQTRIAGPESANALGMPGFGDPEMDVLEAILNGKDPLNATPQAVNRILNAAIFQPLLR